MTRAPIATWHDRGVLHRCRPPLHLLALLVLLTVITSCSDAPTEKEIERADDGLDPSIVTIFANEEIAPTVEQLGDAFSRERSGALLQYTALPSAELTERVDAGARPTLWIDLVDVLDGQGGPAFAAPPREFGDNPILFTIDRELLEDPPTLEVFGAGSSDVSSGLCEPATPCGDTGRLVLEAAGITPDPDLVVDDGKAAIQALADEDIQATLVYRTNFTSLYTKLRSLPLPDPEIGYLRYQSASFTASPLVVEFQEWIDTSPVADEIMLKNGYRPREGEQAR